MKESVIESYLVQEVERRGALCEKHVSPGRRSPPDRLVTWKGVMDLVETKAPGEKARADQERDHERRADLGILVWLLDTHAKVDAYILSRHHVWPHAPKPIASKPDLSQLELRCGVQIDQGQHSLPCVLPLGHAGWCSEE